MWYSGDMLTKYIVSKMSSAHFKVLEDGLYFGEIPSVKGVWAHAKTLKECKRELQDVLEGWLILSLQSGDKIPGLIFKKRRSLEHA